MPPTIYYPGCPESVASPVCSDCPTKELGDVRSIFFVKNSFAFTNISNVAEWTAGIISGDIIVHPFTRGSLEQTPNIQGGFGDQEETLDGYDYQLNVFDPNYKANFAHWNSIKSSKIYKVGYRTESLVHLSENTATIIPSAPIAEGDKKTAVLWNILVKFSQEDLVQPFDMPVGVFEECIDVAP